jgi:chemotaxis protein methyltransferase CheR
MRDLNVLSAQDFRRLRELVYSECGIQIGPERQTMLEGRLRKRLRSLQLDSAAEYCSYIFSGSGHPEEIPQLIDVVTTNKTDFFRESRHFDYLAGVAIPALLRNQNGTNRSLLVWSAGCSTGEEPYKLAMVLSQYAERNKAFRFRLLATDISTQVLEHAQRAIYKSELLKPVPAELRRKYVMRSKDRASPLQRIVPELRDLVEFRRLNLMDSDFGIEEAVDVIFCRNVIIYFDAPTRAGLLDRFQRQLRPGGYLFLGHSETLNGVDVPLTTVGPTVYRKPDGPAN